MRRYLIFVISLLALSVSLLIVRATQTVRDYALRGYVDATQDIDLPYRINRLGVNADLLQYTPDELAQHLEWMRDGNVTWIRQVIRWDIFEPQIGMYNWEALDVVMDALKVHPELQLVPVFMNSPHWARQSTIVTAPPDDPVAIVPFLREFVTRYGNHITYYQIWDEPNLDDAWGMRDPRPAEYGALLTESAQVIRGNDEDARILLGALAPTTERSGQNIADALYLQQLYELGLSESFDIVAGKPYGFDQSPNHRTVNLDTLNFSRLILLREVMVQYDDGHKAVWASNWGWNSLTDDWRGEPSIWGRIGAEEQITYTLEAIERAEREWPWLGGMILHHWQPSVAPDNPQWGFTIISPENTPTALWEALASYNLPNVARNGLYHPRTPYATYSGLWTFSELGADIGWLETSDSQLTFTFAGSDIALRLREGDYFAFLYATVDGDAANALPHDAAGNSYLLLRSDTQAPVVNTVAVARNLMEGIHELHVIADRGWHQWALAGYAVSDGNLRIPYQRQLIVAWLTSAMALIATCVAGYRLPWGLINVRLTALSGMLSTGIQLSITVITSLALMVSLLFSVGNTSSWLWWRRDIFDQGMLLLITLSMILVELPLVIVTLCAVFLFWLIYHHLEWGVLLTLCYAPFFLFPVALYTLFFPMAELLLLITTGAWILRLLSQWAEGRQTASSDFPVRIEVHWHSLDALMGVWVVLGCIAFTWSTQIDPAWTELRTLFIEPALLYLIIRTIRTDATMLWQWMLGVVIAGLSVAVIGLYLYSVGEGVITAEGGARRLASIYGSPNNVGLLLGRMIPFVIAIMLGFAGIRRYLGGIVSVVMLIAVALTQSVGAILVGIPAGIATVLVSWYGRRALPFLLSGLLVGVVVTAGLMQISTRFAGLLDMSSGTNFIRIRVWESSIEILSEYPITGIGLDQFLYAYSGTYVRPDAIADPDLSHPHNIILDFWMRLGIAGVLWLMIVQSIYWREAWRLRQNTDNSYSQVIITGSMGAMMALLLHGMIDNSVFVIDLSYVFVFLLAIIAQLSQSRGTISEHEQRT
ncbi:MAG: O-antigen ligase family protein [Anaerolineae bacterium]